MTPEEAYQELLQRADPALRAGLKRHRAQTLSLFDNDGRSRAATLDFYEPPRGLVRRFCPLHLDRGDCGSEDANRNYIVLKGPGPDQAVGWEGYESKARTEVIDLR